MVGYQESDTMTPHQKLLAGCVSGVTTRFITQPFDVIKVRTQLQSRATAKSYKGNIVKIAKQIFKEEGITAFWHGHALGQMHSILAVSCQFYVYELATRSVANARLGRGYNDILMFMCGAMAGGCSATLVIPLEVVRVRQMLVKDQYKGFINGAKTVYANGGVFAFYEGLSASLCQMVPAVGISFSIFRVVQPFILHQLQDYGKADSSRSPNNPHGPQIIIIASTMAGIVSGFFSKTLTYPFDLAKRRLQISTHKEDKRFKIPSISKHPVKCRLLSDCIIKTFQNEGLRGLYRGWSVTIYKAQLTSVVAFTTYELVCYVIRELDIR